MNSNDSLGGIAGTQRGSGNTQRMAPGPAVVPVVQSPGPFDLNLSAPFQVINDGIFILLFLMHVVCHGNWGLQLILKLS